jgi:hypothetical protein
MGQTFFSLKYYSWLSISFNQSSYFLIFLVIGIFVSFYQICISSYWMHIICSWNWIWLKFQIQDGKKMTSISVLCLGVHGICCWNQKVAPNSNYFLDAQTIELNWREEGRGQEKVDLESARERPQPADVTLPSAVIPLRARERPPPAVVPLPPLFPSLPPMF